jgi:hypothetical protein
LFISEADHAAYFVYGRKILVRYMWLDISPKSARMEQSWSDDGGKDWEVNWVCELSR